MTYTEDQLTGFIYGVPPVRDGVYKTDAGLFAHWSEEFGWGRGENSIEKAYEARKDGAISNFFHIAWNGWRGLSKNPNAKPKSSGNKRKVMYVVCHKATRCAEAVFLKKENAQEYAEYLNFPVYITKIRFRTPEHN